MAEQVVKMVIKVDLQCGCHYKKIEKILCEIPQVKDQSFDEKQNTVTITVECCSPENVRQKILCTGRCFIQSIEIIHPKPVTNDQSNKITKPDPTPVGLAKKPCPPPPVLGYPPVSVMGWVSVCPPCHNRGCGWFCPCNCHCERPPMCDDGCMRPAHECRCGRPLMCRDGCGRPTHECRCGRPPMCRDGCGRPAHECRCQRPSYSRCCDRCNDENASPSCTLHSCDCGRPPVCTNAGYECENSCSHM